MSDESLSLDNMTCPYCDQLMDDATSTSRVHPDELPSVGDSTICAYCAGVGVYTENAIRQATAEELAELGKDPEFRRAMLTVSVAAQLRDQAGLAVEYTHPGHDGDDHPHAHHATMISVVMDDDGNPRLQTTGLPEDIQIVLTEALHQLKRSQMADELRRWVTPEIANHVLSVYGNEQASMPNLTTGALISLIRLCHEADDQMMLNLNEVEDFHGYVMGVVYLAERGSDGIELLEQIAGLRPWTEKEQDAKA